VPANNYWTVTVKVQPGKNVFILRATDDAGNFTLQRILITRF
jgi:hypothetical protein